MDILFPSGRTNDRSVESPVSRARLTPPALTFRQLLIVAARTVALIWLILPWNKQASWFHNSPWVHSGAFVFKWSFGWFLFIIDLSKLAMTSLCLTNMIIRPGSLPECLPDAVEIYQLLDLINAWHVCTMSANKVTLGLMLVA